MGDDRRAVEGADDRIIGMRRGGRGERAEQCGGGDRAGPGQRQGKDGRLLEDETTGAREPERSRARYGPANQL
jgi:hypothetical protein